MEGGAVFDASGNYRYSLWRSWNQQAARVVFVMLNPSTADATANDATIRRCLGFAHLWGYGSLEVVNLFAFRSSDPQTLRQVADPIGQECDRYILAAVRRAERVIVAWGNGGSWQRRDQTVLALLQHDTSLYCLGQNQSGQPSHPLYLKRTVQVAPYPGYCGAERSSAALG
ncbi:MAG: DUF1643 domain-containing protein [Synechococcales cyanobacterium C42_A2020_086]|jgi:hypothetical protein|nr:DUF1643 domain-containing protein [Synechococcales cyanobacterium C42_A2020_086]